VLSSPLLCPAAWATAIFTLSLHDALPIWAGRALRPCPRWLSCSTGTRHFSSRQARRRYIGPNGKAQASEHISGRGSAHFPFGPIDRKSTRLNSSHEWISYAVFCLKKKKQQ